MSRLLHKLALTSFVFISCLPMAWAGEIEDLKKEMRELRQTVNELKDIVKQQNKKIDELSDTKVAAPTPQSENPAIVSENKKEKTNPAPATDESQALLNQVNNAPASPGANTKSLGLWKYPTGNGAVAKANPAEPCWRPRGRGGDARRAGARRPRAAA